MILHRNAGSEPTHLENEIKKIEVTLRSPEVRGLSFEKLAAIPAKYKEGDLYYGLANVFGTTAGLYLREGSVWRKL